MTAAATHHQETLVQEDWMEPEGTFAERCRAARRERGWSYGDICDHLQRAGHDTTRASYASFERGDRETRLAEALALRDLLGVDIDPEPDVDTFGVSMTVHHPDGRMYTASAYGVPDTGLHDAIGAAYTMTVQQHAMVGVRRG